LEENEFPLALQKIQEVLNIDPGNPDAVGLRSAIEEQRRPGIVEAVTSVAYNDGDRTGESFSFDWANEEMSLLLHAGPERSWTVLAEFLRDAGGSDPRGTGWRMGVDLVVTNRQQHGVDHHPRGEPIGKLLRLARSLAAAPEVFRQPVQSPAPECPQVVFTLCAARLRWHAAIMDDFRPGAAAR
jgi:hypothetical protein